MHVLIPTQFWLMCIGCSMDIVSTSKYKLPMIPAPAYSLSTHGLNVSHEVLEVILTEPSWVVCLSFRNFQHLWPVENGDMDSWSNSILEPLVGHGLWQILARKTPHSMCKCDLRDKLLYLLCTLYKKVRRLVFCAWLSCLASICIEYFLIVPT